MKKILLPMVLVSAGLLFALLATVATGVATDAPGLVAPHAGPGTCGPGAPTVPTPAEIKANPSALAERASRTKTADLVGSTGCDYLVLPATPVRARDIASDMEDLPPGARVAEMRGYMMGIETVASLGLTVREGETVAAAVERLTGLFEESFEENISQAGEPIEMNPINDGLYDEPPLPGQDDGSLVGPDPARLRDLEADAREADIKESLHFLDQLEAGNMMIVAIRVETDDSARSAAVPLMLRIGSLVAVERNVWVGGAVVVPVVGGES